MVDGQGVVVIPVNLVFFKEDGPQHGLRLQDIPARISENSIAYLNFFSGSGLFFSLARPSALDNNIPDFIAHQRSGWGILHDTQMQVHLPCTRSAVRPEEQIVWVKVIIAFFLQVPVNPLPFLF